VLSAFHAELLTVKVYKHKGRSGYAAGTMRR
jgi:hypothetical protein